MNDFTILFLVLIVYLVANIADVQTCNNMLFYSQTIENQNLSVKPVSTCEEYDYCFKLDKDRLHTALFSTKTAYQKAKQSKFDQDFYVSNCTASKIWLLNRHGTRLPSKKTIKRLVLMEKLRDEIVANFNVTHSNSTTGQLCSEDLLLLKQWQPDPNIIINNANHLVAEGYNELKSISREYQRLFPHLFDKQFDAQKFHFRHTDQERTRSSFRAFVNGLFGENAHTLIEAEAPLNQTDLLLKAYDFCPAWKKQKKAQNLPASESKQFERSEIYRKLIDDISVRLGFNKSLDLTQINDIYDMCRFEQAWNVNDTSPWCSLITPAQNQVIEYKNELIYFYKSSHGSKINKNIQCATVADMLKHFDSKDLPKSIVYFTHSAAIQLLLTALGALKDTEPLTAENYSKMGQRKWKTSRISPFAANIAAVRYDCPASTDEIKIKFFLNEQPLKFDWCTDDGTCKFSDVKSNYRKYTNGNCESIFCNDN